MQNFLNYEVFLYLMIVKILANSADPDAMQLEAAFHLSLHSLPKICIWVSNIQRVYTKLSKIIFLF